MKKLCATWISAANAAMLALAATALAGCPSGVNLYNPDGSLNTLNQTEILYMNYSRMNRHLYESENAAAVQYMMKIRQLTQLLPELAGHPDWNGARDEVLKQLGMMEAAFRIGDTFEARRFSRKAGGGINMLRMLGPVLFDKEGRLKDPGKNAGEAKPPAGTVPFEPARPPGLYDD
ncbi:MAG: hypothetical protein JW909_11865 [Planctomycetes bacterium]|nr:hypothetical protein [Planctomycetota bacterium]